MATPPGRPRQRGITLIVALVVLIAMTLSAIGLMRSVFTSNRIVGNLSFQQAATQSADIGIETAVAWLETNSVGATLFNSITIGGAQTVAYSAFRQDPEAGQTWEQFWAAVLATNGRVNNLPEDAAGNAVSFVIQRLCATAGDPTSGVGCSSVPTAIGSEGNSRGAGVLGLEATGQTYYRITTRVAGPRNTVSFVQAVVAI